MRGEALTLRPEVSLVNPRYSYTCAPQKAMRFKQKGMTCRALGAWEALSTPLDSTA